MLKSLAVVALFAASNAEVELTAGPDNTMVVRRVAMTSLTDIDVRLAEIEGNARVAAGAAAYNATLQATMAMTAAINDLQTNVATQLAGQNAQISTQLAAISTAASTAQVASEETIAALRTELTAATNASMATLSNAVAAEVDEIPGQLEAITASVANQLSVAAAATTTAVRAMNTTLNNGLVSKMPKMKHIWIGGCSRSLHGGWHDICMDRNELDTAAPYFRKSSNTRMTAIRRGVFQMSTYHMNSACGWAHDRAIMAGQEKLYTYDHAASGWWKDQSHTTMAELTPGQTFYFSVHASCGHNAHHATSGNGRYHSRQTYTYMGAARAADY